MRPLSTRHTAHQVQPSQGVMSSVCSHKSCIPTLHRYMVVGFHSVEHHIGIIFDLGFESVVERRLRKNRSANLRLTKRCGPPTWGSLGQLLGLAVKFSVEN